MRIDWNSGRLPREDAPISNIENKAHGLTGTLVAPDWPLLTLDEVAHLLRQYPQAGGATALLSFSPRPFSAGSVAATPGGKVFVKRHHQTVRDREGLGEEHRFIARLAARTNLVQAALVRADGETVTTHGEWSYEVHPLATGVDAYEQALSWTPFLSCSHAEAAGRAMAEVHRAAAGFDAPARKQQQLVTSYTLFAQGEPVRAMETYLAGRPALLEYLEKRDWRREFARVILPFYEKLRPWAGFLHPQWTHNDFHASNLTWTSRRLDSEVTGVFDFGLADKTNAVHDIATAIERNIVEWLLMEEPAAEVLHLDHLDALLAGYEQSSPLSYEQAQALVAMLPVVHCEFALSETDYFLSILHSEEKAFLAYEGYFLAHAEWFNSRQGRRLLEHLRLWAEDEDRPKTGGGGH